MPKTEMPEAKKNHLQPVAPIAQILGSGMAGLAEISLFHPTDTLVKRWQKASNKLNKVSVTQAKGIIFQDAHNQNVINQLRSLYSGLTTAVAYKFTQRVYKFGGQPIVMEQLKQSPVYGFYQRQFGNHADPLLRATAGSIIGAGEVAFLPLDALKVKCQTSQNKINFRGVVKLIREERLNLYNGAGWTLARNIPGSFLLFGGDAAAKKYLFELKKHGDASPIQVFLASGTGAFASIFFTNPLDVIKTRIQAQQGSVQGMRIFTQTIKEEGLSALFRGVTPKLVTAGPKLTISFALSQLFTEWFDKELRNLNDNNGFARLGIFNQKTPSKKCDEEIGQSCKAGPRA